jgi:FkbM family methyltransferase
MRIDGRKMRRIDQCAVALLGDSNLVIVDVGAAYGLPRHLGALERVALVCFFEPHEERARELRQVYMKERGLSNVRVFTDALAAQEGLRTLHVTNVPTGSSLLVPGGEFMEEFGDPSYFFPLKKVEVHTRRLADVLAQAGIARADAIKLDVQGAELEVLEGLGSGLSVDTLGIELEIGLPGAYLEQPSLGQVQAFMDARGFRLYDLRPVSHHRSLDGDRTGYTRRVFEVSADSRSLTKRITEADGLFFRKPDILLDRRDAGAVRRLAVLLCTYGFFIEAFDLVNRAVQRGLLGAAEAATCLDAITKWHRAVRDSLFDSRWFGSLATFMRRGYRQFRRRVLGKHVGHWRD